MSPDEKVDATGRVGLEPARISIVVRYSRVQER